MVSFVTLSAFGPSVFVVRTTLTRVVQVPTL
jgi:hypothetical protein